MSEISATDRYAFLAEWFDAEASLVKKFYLFFFPFDHTLELFDIKNRRVFLRRTKCEGVTTNELFVGNTIEVFTRQMKITDYADELTKKKMSFSMQKTFAVIKPDGMKNKGPIIRMLYENGFKISKLKMVNLTSEEAAKLYMNHAGQSYLPYLIQHITSGPVLAMELVAENAISKMRDLVGPLDPADAKVKAPNSIRACFGTSKNHNALHCSDDVKSVAEESEVIFKSDPAALISGSKTSARFHNSTCCIVKPCAVKDGKLGEIMSLIQENNFDITAMQMFCLDYNSASEFYEVYKGVVAEYPAMVSHLISGPCVAMEIVGPSGVDTPFEFRKLVGPTDPDIARQLRPDTIRARYGKNKIQNAVHVTDLPEDALLEVQYFFKILCTSVL